MTTKTIWNELYQDLPPSLGEKLREARIKPDKLKQMTDGEILSIQGVGASALDKVRAAYPIASIDQVKDPKTQSTTKTNETTDDSPSPTTTSDEDSSEKTAVIKKPKKSPSSRYLSLKKQVKEDKLYPLEEAIELITKLNEGRKTNTLELHINTIDTGIKGEVSLPHSTGKKQVIEVFSEKTIVKINAGKLNFDILLATPKDMPKLAKYAKTLGPKGLMPNPKNGNLIENTKKRLEELEKGSTLPYKTEPKFPIIHTSIGSSTQKSKHLSENILALIKHVNLIKIKSVFITSTQSPSVKLDLSSL